MPAGEGSLLAEDLLASAAAEDGEPRSLAAPCLCLLWLWSGGSVVFPNPPNNRGAAVTEGLVSAVTVIMSGQ